MEILAVVSDLHCNSRQGLMPPEVELNEGLVATASGPQLWIWDRWLEFWKRVEKIKKRYRAGLVTLINGEACDVNKYNSTELVSADPSDAIRIALAALEVPKKITDKFVVSYGTEAHVGENGFLDRVVADRLGAVSNHWNRFEVGGIKVDAMHHPKMNTRVKWTKGGAANRMALDLEVDYVRQGWTLPDIALRGHVHVPQDSGFNFPIHMWVLPSWKLTDSYVSRLGEPFPAPIGGMIFYRKHSGKIESEVLKYEWPITEREPFPKVLV